ncbi:ankyrin repeat and MYND domain-containing protein 1-like isoform X2 [Lineus longissimus]|uniref:ankyrin repeat and MYND domain-containing protein 1-like isoform X2 n=1 Tax=Lineus longissimus TaxID=88925 RepID=UPI00315C73CE
MKTTALSSTSLPKLRTGKFTETDPGEIQKTYKSGASFKGHVRDNVRSGHGIFTWPNGARYEGEYDNNARNGKGIQLWADRSEYTGDFVEDMRHGEGKHVWANGESYTGVFFRDRRHGKGEYRWPDGSWFVGTFYMDKKEGYGAFHFTDGSKFEGLYKDDEREGPGVLTYQDNSQDVGLWHREGLVRICSSLPGAFTMGDHSEFEYNPEDHKQFIKVNDEECNKGSLQNDIVKAPPAVFDYDPDATNRVLSSFSREASSLYCESLDSRSAAIDRKPFDEEFFKSTLETDDNEIVAWNNTPSSVEMQKHIWKHRHFQNLCSFNANKILDGERVQESKKGQIESASDQLITAAQMGDLVAVKELLDDGKVFVDVSDKCGHTALLGAAVNWYQDIINTLLDHGADVNKLNNEGLSALSACAVFFYPIDQFLYNIAERYMEKPPEVEVEFDPNVQGILVTDKERGDEKKSGKRGKQKPIQNSDSKTTLDSGVSSPRVSARRGQKAHKHAKNEMIMDMKTVTEQLMELAPSLTSEPLEEKPEVKPRLRTSTDPGCDSLYDSDEGNSYRNELNTPYSGFESNASVRNFSINVTSQLMERCATQLSQNQMVVDRRRRSSDTDLTGTVRTLAIRKSDYTLMEDTILLLLQRGANPNASSVPMPILFFAIKAADVSMVKVLLLKGASTSAKLSNEKGGLAPLHIACAIPGEEGVQITELLLNSLADPDVRAADDDSFLGKTLQEEWSKDVIDDWSRSVLGGRTPLHIACARDDDYKSATRVVHLLLQHHANPNLLCNGHSPLSLAITSGNDTAIDFLLKYCADPSLPLTHGVGSALCVASSTEYEHRRTIDGRIALIDKLIKAGANILAPILVGLKRIAGTAVDYAYHMYNLDRRIAHMPYHALTQAERETFNARRKLLAHDGDLLREAAVAKEKMRIEEEEILGCRSTSPSPDFVFTGAGAPLPPGSRGRASDSKVSFKDSKGQLDGEGTRKPLFKYCYECGRSVGIRLTACTRCKEVFYCSKACKLKAWNARHKEECVRVGGPESRKGHSQSKAALSDDEDDPSSPRKHKETTAAKVESVKGILKKSKAFSLR